MNVSKQAINDQTYNSAETMLKNGNYLESIKLFASLDGYRNSGERYSQAVKAQAAVLSQLSTSDISDFLSGMSNKISNDIISEMDVLPVFLLQAPKVRVGDIIRFGYYEQDNDISNGKEAIEWIVLEREKNKFFLISKYGLDTRKFNDSESFSITWETCSLRNWLNNNFYNSAFSNGEKEYILTTTVPPAEVIYETNVKLQGNATKDKLYLLSSKELNKYFGSSKEKRLLKATDYAETQSANPYFSEYASWWLRTITKGFSGAKSTFVANVYKDGSYSTDDSIGVIATFLDNKVRPVMWVSY